MVPINAFIRSISSMIKMSKPKDSICESTKVTKCEGQT